MKKFARVLSLFFRKTKNPLCYQGELVESVEKGSMALSQNTLKKMKRLLKGRLLKIFNPIRPKDFNAMLKSILVTTANGKPQTASSRLPFAVNAMLKVSNGSVKLSKVYAKWHNDLQCKSKIQYGVIGQQEILMLIYGTGWIPH